MATATSPVLVPSNGLPADERSAAALRPARLPFAPPIVGLPVSAASDPTFAKLFVAENRHLADFFERLDPVGMAVKRATAIPDPRITDTDTFETSAVIGGALATLTWKASFVAGRIGKELADCRLESIVDADGRELPKSLLTDAEENLALEFASDNYDGFIGCL